MKLSNPKKKEKSVFPQIDLELDYLLCFKKYKLIL